MYVILSKKALVNIGRKLNRFWDTNIFICQHYEWFTDFYVLM